MDDDSESTLPDIMHHVHTIGHDKGIASYSELAPRSSSVGNVNVLKFLLRRGEIEKESRSATN